MKTGIMPKASSMPFRFGWSDAVLSKRISFKRRSVSKDALKRMIAKDAKSRIRTDFKSTEQFIKGNGFARYDGDVKRYAEYLESMPRNDFLVVTYIGKIQNNLKVEFKNPDLSTLAYLNRLDSFAKALQGFTGRRTRIRLAMENDVFDSSIFIGVKPSHTRRMMDGTRKFASEFGLKNVECVPLSSVIGGKAYKKAFGEYVDHWTRHWDELRKVKNFESMFYTPFTSYPTQTFEEAVRLYTTSKGLKKVKDWTKRSVIRYSAFHDARTKTDFWNLKQNRGYIRSTVSGRPEVLSFDYSMGRIAALHGMAATNKGRLDTEYFYDIVRANRSNNVNLDVWHYKGVPFYTDVSRLNMKL
ncbi:MAG: hypothetical protein KGH69_01115 [Candidatus Micrarchaeota archaeon]|nr:hypothetical protein [Candidatus Micrarchaeota archaeon]